MDLRFMGLKVCYSLEQGECQCRRITPQRVGGGPAEIELADARDLLLGRRARRRCMPSASLKEQLGTGEAEYNFCMSQVKANAPAWSGKIILNVRKRRVAFHHYKCITGMWPLLTAVLYAGRFLLMLGLIAFLLWYGRQHSASANRVTLYSLIAFVPLIFVWNVLETLAWNFELRRRGLIGQGIYLGLTQIPAG